MKRLLTIVTILCLLLAGCTKPIETQTGTPEPEQPPDTETWISPGKIEVDQFYPGAEAECPITIHNGNSTATQFKVYYRIPDHINGDYTKAPLYVRGWITIENDEPILQSGETLDVMVVLRMPKGAEVFSPKWEFWIAIKDMSQKEMVRTELACRWLISIR